MNDEKKELKVAALENGTVIDHIPSSQLFKVVSILGLENCTNSITIGNNLASKKIGKKGIIKVADRFFKEEDLNKIALVARLHKSILSAITKSSKNGKYLYRTSCMALSAAETPNALRITNRWKPYFM